MQFGWVLLVTVLISGVCARVGWPAPGDAFQSPPIAVTFGVQSLTPSIPVNSSTAFVSQRVTLPDVVCTRCTAEDTWTQTWSASTLTLDSNNSRVEEGWYVFRSGLSGIGIGVRTDKQAPRVREGQGRQVKELGELEVGLVRVERHVEAGLADLPATEFTRVTTFLSVEGEAVYQQVDRIRVSADFRVPTCTSQVGGLHFQLPKVDRGWLRQHVKPGGVAQAFSSLPQLVLANCSENTRNVRLRFIPLSEVMDSTAGPATLLVGQDSEQQTVGVGFVMQYDAEGFGQHQHGTVRWDAKHPVVLSNPTPTTWTGELREGVRVSLQVFYARPDNGLPMGAGNISAKGMYQVSYD
ncbi:hypothetical protein [Providencia sp. JUb39]|uniref:hypothetical protein n=1 Tax=Providencia sp. JUb39 TaxID=2724165 RepID=UPI00164DA1C4|nr:hypothetical protein [Providencia sp. JUb39]